MNRRRFFLLTVGRPAAGLMLLMAVRRAQQVKAAEKKRLVEVRGNRRSLVARVRRSRPTAWNELARALAAMQAMYG